MPRSSTPDDGGPVRSVSIMLLVYADPELAQEIAGRAIRLVKERVEGGDIDGHSRWQYVVTVFRPKGAGTVRRWREAPHAELHRVGPARHRRGCAGD